MDFTVDVKSKSIVFRYDDDLDLGVRAVTEACRRAAAEALPHPEPVPPSEAPAEEPGKRLMRDGILFMPVLQRMLDSRRGLSSVEVTEMFGLKSVKGAGGVRTRCKNELALYCPHLAFGDVLRVSHRAKMSHWLPGPKAAEALEALRAEAAKLRLNAA